MPYIILIIVLIALDQITKYLVVANFQYGETLPIIKDFFHLTYVQNQGIAFGMFQSKTKLLAVITVIAVVGVSCYMYKEVKKSPVTEKIAYSLILAGAIGNMIDRIFRDFVVDMVDFRGIWQFVFNLADAWINIGVALLIIDFLIFRRKK